MGTVIRLIFVWCRRQLCNLICGAPFFSFLQNSLLSFPLAVCCLSEIYVIILFLELVQFMNAFDRAMNLLDDNFSFLASTKQIVSSADDDDKVNMLPNDCTILIHNFMVFATCYSIKSLSCIKIDKIELLSSFKKTYNRCCEHNVKKVFLKHEWLEKIKPLTSHCLLWDFELISCVTDCYFIINCLIVFSFVGYIVFERGDLIFVFNFHPENTYEGYALYVQFSFVFRDINCDRLCIYVW